MNYFSKCASSVATGIFAAAFALSLAPIGRAQSAVQAAGDSSASSNSAVPAKSTQRELDDLQKEMAALQQQIAALRAQQDAGPKVEATSFVQTPSAAPADAKVNLAGLLGPTTISGFVDAYYGYNYNHPYNNISGLRFFDAPANGFSFNMAELIVDKAPDATSTDSRMGYHVSAGYGLAAANVNSTDVLTDGSSFYIKEAYGSYLAPIGKGLTIHVGKFVTSNGDEVIETNANWNYSRSLLFYYAIPYYHFGVNASYTFNPKWMFTGYLVNGWNNTAIIHDSVLGQSSGLLYAGSLMYTPNAKWSVTQNYYAGPVTDAQRSAGTSLNDWKQLSDTVISYTPNAKWAFALNGDYGFGPQGWSCEGTACAKVGPQVKWWGAAGYAKYSFNPKSYFAARYEYYEDPQDYTGLGANHAQEATGTYAYNLTSGFQVRGEYRYDFASSPIFRRGAGFVKEQNTATIGFIYSFSSANAK